MASFLTERADGARAAGIPAERIVLDAGLDLGKTAEQSLTLLRASSTLAALGLPAVALRLQQDLPRRDRSISSSPSGARLPSARRRSASPGAAASCACTTSRAPAGSATRSPRSARRSERRRRAVVRRIWSRATTPSLVAQEVRALLADVVGDRDHALVVEEIGGGAGRRASTSARWSTPASRRPSSSTGASSSCARPAGSSPPTCPGWSRSSRTRCPSTVLILVGGGGTVPGPAGQGGHGGRTGHRRHRRAGRGTARPGCTSTSGSAPVKLEPQAAAAAGPARRRGPRPGRGPPGRAGARPTARGPGSRPTIWSRISARRATSPATSSPTPSTGATRPGPRSCCTACPRRAGWPRSRCWPPCTGTSPTCWRSTATTSRSGRARRPQLLGHGAVRGKKALEQSRRLGSARIAEAIKLCWPTPTSTCKGATGLPAELVVEILVARLARQTRPSRPRAGAVPTIGRSDTGTPNTPDTPNLQHARTPRCWTRRMHETPDELRRLQQLLDAGAADAGPHLRDIITRRAPARCGRADRDAAGMRLLVLATVTADGRPLSGPVDGYFLHGTFWFSSGRDSVRMRHLAARPGRAAPRICRARSSP